MEQEKSYINKEMTIQEIIELYPETMEIIMEYQLSCVGCGAAGFETIEQGALGHGMSEEEVGMLVRDVNKVIQQSREINIKQEN